MENRAKLLKIHEWLVDWSEKGGFDWIHVDVYYSPSPLLLMTVRKSKSPMVSATVLVSRQEIASFSEEDLFTRILPAKVERLMQDMNARQKQLEQVEEIERKYGPSKY